MKHKIRVRDGFSDRNAIDPIPKIIQYSDLSPETRIALFNSLYNIVNHQIQSLNYDTDSLTKIVVENMFNEIYKGKYKYSYSDLMNDILEIFINDKYHVVMTIIEYMCNLVYESYNDFYINPHYHGPSHEYYNTREKMNNALEREFVGYRFIDDKITKITSEEEINEIKNAIVTPYSAVNDSISKALSMLSETGNKDYKNSIKESVMALEQLCNILLNKNGLTLSNAVEQICNLIDINSFLKESIKKLYKFASDENGIRHGNNKKNYDIRFDDAKYILVFCSSTINYFLSLKNEIDLALIKED